VTVVRKATRALSMLTNSGIVEQEHNGVIAPNARSLSWPRTAPPAIQLRNRCGPKSRLISATASDITRNTSSSSTRRIGNEPGGVISINGRGSQGGGRSAGALALRGQRRQVRQPAHRISQLSTTHRIQRGTTPRLRVHQSGLA